MGTISSCAGYNMIYKKIHLALTSKRAMPLTAVYCAAQTGEYVFTPLKEIYPCWEVVGDKNFQIGTIGHNSITWDEEELKNGIPMMLLLSLVNIANTFFYVVEDVLP